LATLDPDGTVKRASDPFSRLPKRLGTLEVSQPFFVKAMARGSRESGILVPGQHPLAEVIHVLRRFALGLEIVVVGLLFVGVVAHGGPVSIPGEAFIERTGTLLNLFRGVFRWGRCGC